MSDEIKYEMLLKNLMKQYLSLKNGTVSLDESIKLFEKGTKLAGICSDKLKKAEQKITMLTKENNND